MQQDLALAGDGEQGSPRRSGQRMDRRGASGLDRWLQQQVGRHGWRSVRLGGRVGAQGGLEFRLGRLARGRRFRFQQPATDPLDKRFNLFVGKLVALWRHLLFPALAHGSDQGGCSVAGLDDFPARPALEGGGKRREIQAAFCLVRVVTVQAGLLQNRENVVVIGGQLLGKTHG